MLPEEDAARGATPVGGGTSKDTPSGPVAQGSSKDAQPGQIGLSYLRLIGLGALVGAPAALIAAVFLATVHELEHWLWTDLPRHLGASTPPWYLVICLPVLGAGIVCCARLLLPGDGGNEPLEGIGGGAVPVSHAPGIALAALGTLAFGAVLGPEAPLIALGSVTGVLGASLARLARKEQAVIAEAGSFSAISALFDGPIVGGMLMIEGGVGMGEALIPILIPGFVAAAVGYVLFVGLGNWGGLHAQGLVVPGLPAYHGTHIEDLFIAIVVGAGAAIVIAATRRLAGAIFDERKRISMPWLLLAGGLTIGLIAQVADWLGANSQDVLFSGQASVPALAAESSTAILLLLLAAKMLGYAVSLGCGFRGGPVFPAIFLGIAVATFAVEWLGVSPTLAVSVGTAAGMAATTRLLLTPMVFAALLVGSNGVDTIPAAVLAATAAWLVITRLNPRSKPA